MRTEVILVAVASCAFAQAPAELDADASRSADAALAWLARQQHEDGHWSARADGPHDFTRLYEPDAAAQCDLMATSCALLAFLAGGHTAREGSWRETAARAHAWIVARMEEEWPAVDEGATLAEREGAHRRETVARLNVLWGALALCEAWDGPAAQRALVRIAMGERFDFADPARATTDELALLGAVRYVGAKKRLRFHEDWFDGQREALRKILTGWTEKVAPYRATEEGEIWFRGQVSTAQAMTAWRYLGMDRSWDMLADCAPALLRNPPAWNPYFAIGAPAARAQEVPGEAAGHRDEIANELGWLWQAMAIESLGGDGRLTWRRSFVPLAVRHQRKGGAESGSWDPSGPHARVFGREVSTAWMAIALRPGAGLAMGKFSWSKLQRPEWERFEDLGPVTRETCAVCGLEVLSNTVFRIGEGPRIFYFCSAEHHHRFQMDPAKYR